MSISTGFNLGNTGYTPLARSITKEEETLLVRVFHEADEGRKGFLNNGDLKVAVVEIFGYKPAKFEVKQIMGVYGERITDTVTGLPLEKFVTSMSDKLVKRDQDEEIRHTFMAFDMQCRGFISVEDLKKVFSQVAPHIHAQTAHSIFRELDQNGDGRISYKDFEYLMKYNTADQL